MTPSDVISTEQLWFGPGDPVRAASGVARLGAGWLIAQDDAVHAGWWRPPFEHVDRVRVLPDRSGRATFSASTGTKDLKPDLESACSVTVDGRPAVLLLGSGSLPNRTSGILVEADDDGVAVRSADLTALYARVGPALGLRPEQVNLEGACVVGDRLRWFQRGHGRSGVPSASVDLGLAAVLACLTDGEDPGAVPVDGVREYDLGELAGSALAVTDAVALPDGRVCVAATAEDAPDAIADGPVAGSVLALLGASDEADVLPLPLPLAALKAEGLALAGCADGTAELLVVVDQDDPEVASLAVRLALDLRT